MTTVANRHRPGALVGDLDAFWRNHLPIGYLAAVIYGIEPARRSQT